MAMTPDTRSILTSLRFMKDSELQQYAAMHKNDPFIFPLAFQESQMRKQVRAEEQAKQQQPQAKVVDQNLAAMAAEPLPEDVGIAQLPANNLQGIATGAAGGIVAFDEGGEVPRFNGTVGSMVGPQYDFKAFLSQWGLTPQNFNSLDDFKKQELRDTYKQMFVDSAPTGQAGATTQAAARTPTMTERGIAAIGNAASSAGNYLKRGLGGLGKISPWAVIADTLYGPPPEDYLERNRRREAIERATKAGEAFDPTTMASIGAGAKDLPAMPANKDVFGGTGATGAGGADQGGKTPPPPAPPKAPTVAPTTFKPAEAPSLASAKELAGQLLDAGEYKKNIQDYQKAEQDAVDAARLARKEGKPEGKAYEEYEKTLRDETADLGKRKGEAQGEAWLTAGLAVLGGSSPYALQNLSLATKGVEQYRDAMKDIRKATRENAKGLADIAQARRAEERGDWEKTQEFEERASTRMSNARKFGVEGIMGLGVKNAELAGRAYDTQVTQAGMDRRTFAELQSRENIARAQVAAQIAAYNAPGHQERLFSTLGGGDVAKGLGVYAKVMGPEARGEEANRARAFHDWSTSYLLQQQYKNFEDYYRLSGAQSAVRKVPELMSEPARQNRP
jgi:tetratricopeptide (TPR) repeat protein